MTCKTRNYIPNSSNLVHAKVAEFWVHPGAPVYAWWSRLKQLRVYFKIFIYQYPTWQFLRRFPLYNWRLTSNLFLVFHYFFQGLQYIWIRIMNKHRLFDVKIGIFAEGVPVKIFFLRYVAYFIISWLHVLLSLLVVSSDVNLRKEKKFKMI